MVSSVRAQLVEIKISVGLSFNGRMVALHASDGGSIPPRSTKFLFSARPTAGPMLDRRVIVVRVHGGEPISGDS